MADVHRATDVRLERPVAVKVLRDAKEAPRFDAEIHTLAQLRHPGIVSLLDAGSMREGTPFLVLELRTEPTLEALLARGPLPADRVMTIARGLADALAYLHERGVVHRDVKPANVFVDDDDAVRLTDFGIARVVGAASLTATGFTMGTARYLAPEQLEGGAVTPAVDVYALGLMMIECLSGEPAFAGTHAEIASARLVRDPELPLSTPARWRALLEAMTSRDPALRPEANRVAAELAALSAPVVTGGLTHTMPLALAEPKPRRVRRNLVALGALAAAALVGLAVAASSGDSNPAGNLGPGVNTSTTIAALADTTPSVGDTTTSTAVAIVVPPPKAPRPHHKSGHDTGNHSGQGDGGGD
jgi:serine/threonine protein kinase